MGFGVRRSWIAILPVLLGKLEGCKVIYMPGFQAPGGVTLGSVAIASNFVLGSIGFLSVLGGALCLI